jgi:hypothetical protein
MRRLFVIVIAAGLILSMVSMTWAATLNLNRSKANIDRMAPGAQLVSASIWVGANQAQIIHTTAATGDFVLTQFCASPVNGGMFLLAGEFGIAHTDRCQTFEPGVVMPKGAPITCATTEHAEQRREYFCMIAGLLTP